MRHVFTLLILSISFVSFCLTDIEKKSPVQFGDPFILNDHGTYYMYGTANANQGIKVYKSNDLISWTDGTTDGFALIKDDVWGNTNYWAPEVYYLNDLFYMFFSVEEHIAVATSNSPLGPFKQEVKAPLLTTKAIDTHLFVDDDGRKYLYYVAFANGNVIWMCEMGDDLMTIKKNTIKKCFEATQDWEHSLKEPVANVNEGPYMLKHKGTYYLVYSANHFANPDYAIGYATASNPTGPWTKHKGNPIVSTNGKITGPGHCAFFKDENGKLNIVYHSHYSSEKVQPRLVHINKCEFVEDPNGGNDILSIVEPLITPVLKN